MIYLQIRNLVIKKERKRERDLDVCVSIACVLKIFVICEWSGIFYFSMALKYVWYRQYIYNIWRHCDNITWVQFMVRYEWNFFCVFRSCFEPNYFNVDFLDGWKIINAPLLTRVQTHFQIICLQPFSTLVHA